MTKSENVIEVHNLSKKYHIGATRETHQSLQQVMLNSMLMPVRRIASMRRNRLLTEGYVQTSRRSAERKPGRYCAELENPAWTLNAGAYTLMVTLGVPYVGVHDRNDDVIEFEIDDENSSRREWYSKGLRPGVIGIDLPWTYHEDEPV